jgi:protein-tyrosine phosphatase
MPHLDMSLVAPRLFIGSRPSPNMPIKRRRIGVLVLCAREYQPPSHLFPGLTILRVPIDDDGIPLSQDDVALVVSSAYAVSRYLKSGVTVLVTCYMGLNRSALVAAIAMQLAYGMAAKEAVARIRRLRSPYALSNRQFEKLAFEFADSCDKKNLMYLTLPDIVEIALTAYDEGAAERALLLDYLLPALIVSPDDLVSMIETAWGRVGRREALRAAMNAYLEDRMRRGRDIPISEE